MVESTLVQSLPAILESLPTLFFLSDVVFYVVTILFFGSISIKGFRGFLGFLPHLGLRIVMGILSLIGGLFFKDLFPQLGEGVYQLVNADVLAGSFVSSVVLGAGLYLLSFHLINVKALEKRIGEMQKRIQDAKRVPAGKLGFRDPVKLVGVAVIVVFVLLSLTSFRGFPSMSDRSLAVLGLSTEQLGDMQKQIENLKGREGSLPAGCDSILSILQVTGPDISSLPVVTDSAVEALLEQGSGSPVLEVRKARFNNKDYFLGFNADFQLCHATSEAFCGCFDTAGL